MTQAAKLVIVGAGQAGARAALAARDCDPQAAIAIYGQEPHPPYERPELSKSLLLDPQGKVPYILDQAAMAEQRIELETGCAIVAIDRNARQIVRADGARIGYDRLLLATGSRLRTLAIEGVDSADILYLRDLDHCAELERRLHRQPAVAVIGGGFIGLEVAAAARRRGCDVTVIEAGDRLLPRLGSPEASEMVARHHRADRVDIRIGVGVLRGAGGLLHLSDGSTVRGDVIVAGIGVIPETRLAERAGLKVEDGIMTDASGRTSDPLIYAAGDATRQHHPALGRATRLESWQNANNQGEAAGRSLAGCMTENAEIPWVWSDQGSLNIQIAGAPEDGDQVIARHDPEGDDGVTLLMLKASRLVGGITLNRGGDMAVIRRLLTQDELARPAEALADSGIPLRKFALGRRAA